MTEITNVLSCTLRKIEADDRWMAPTLKITLDLKNITNNSAVDIIDMWGYLAVQLEKELRIGRFQNPKPKYTQISTSPRPEKEFCFWMDITPATLERITSKISETKEVLLKGRVYIDYKIINSNPESGVVEIRDKIAPNITINLIEWLKIIEKLNFSKYSVFIVPKIETDGMDQHIKEKLEDIDSRMNTLLTDFQKGSYENVLINSRLLLGDIKAIFADEKIKYAIDRGIKPDQGYDGKKDRIKKISTDVSDFCGTTAHSGELPEGARVPWPVNREDAQLVLYSTFSLVSLLSKYLKDAYE